VWNKDSGDHPAPEGLEVLASVPEDALVLEASRRGENVFTLPGESPAFQAIRGMVESLFATPFVKQK
jgi:hypothetical protein